MVIDGFDVSRFFHVFNVLTLIVILAGLVYVAVLAAFVRDFSFITAHPIAFVMECIAMFALPGLPILFFIITQGVKANIAFKWFYALGIKFVIFHILLHVSGLYKVWFELDSGLNI